MTIATTSCKVESEAEFVMSPCKTNLKFGKQMIKKVWWYVDFLAITEHSRQDIKH